MNKYQQTIEKIEMSDEMKNRILNNVASEFEAQNTKESFFAWNRFGKLIPLIACAVLIAIPLFKFMIFGTLNNGKQKPVFSDPSNGSYCTTENLIQYIASADKLVDSDVTYSFSSSSNMVIEDSVMNGKAEVQHNFTCDAPNTSKPDSSTLSIPGIRIEGQNSTARACIDGANNWERILRDGTTVMLFDDEKVMQNFTHADTDRLDISIKGSTKEYSFLINGVATITYQKKKDTVFFSTTVLDKVNLEALAGNDKAHSLMTARGNINVADADSDYLAAWWTEDRNAYWLYSPQKKSDEWLLEVLGKPSK